MWLLSHATACPLGHHERDKELWFVVEHTKFYIIGRGNFFKPWEFNYIVTGRKDMYCSKLVINNL